MPKVNYRISLTAGSIFIAFAIIADGLQALLQLLWFTGFLGIVAYIFSLFISLLYVFSFSVITFMYGVNVFGGKKPIRKIGRFLLTFIAEFMPFMQFFPALSYWTFTSIRDSRQEDKKNAKANATIEKDRVEQMRAMRRKRQALRREEMRLSTQEQRAANDNESSLKEAA